MAVKQKQVVNKLQTMFISFSISNFVYQHQQTIFLLPSMIDYHTF